MYKDNRDKPIKKANVENDIPEPVTPDSRLLALILMAIEDETAEAIKYKTLSESAPDQHARDIFRQIYLDESRHKRLFERIYTSIAGSPPPEIPIPQLPILEYSEQLRINVLDELGEARFYRDIFLLLENLDYAKLVDTIINDEQNHAVLNNYLSIGLL